MLIKEEFEAVIQPLQKAFPEDWHEVVAMVITRVDGYLPLKRVKDMWEKLTNLFEIPPNCDPKNLSEVLSRIGQDRSGQNHIFSNLASNDDRLIYDLSYVFSDSDYLRIAEKGYNGKRVYLPQVNIDLFSGIDSCLPIMIRGVPGSVKDVKTLENSLSKLD